MLCHLVCAAIFSLPTPRGPAPFRVGKMPVFPNTALLDLGLVSPKFLFNEIREYLVSIGVVASDLRGLYNRPDVSRQQIHLTFNSSQKHEAFCRSFSGKSQSVVIKGKIDGKEVLRNVRMAVIDISKNWKDVRIGGLPMVGFDLSILERRLRSFGEVKEAEWETYYVADKDDPYGKVYTGYVKVKVVVESIIPNFIQVGDYQVTVKYRGQPKTCALCDSVEHLAAACPKNRKNTDPNRGNGGYGPGKPQTRNPSNPWGTNPPKRSEVVQPQPELAIPAPEPDNIPAPTESPTVAAENAVAEPDVSEKDSAPQGIESTPSQVEDLESPLIQSFETTESRNLEEQPLPDDDFEMEDSELIPAGQVPRRSSISHVSETQDSMDLEGPPVLTPIGNESEESAPASKFLKGAQGSKQEASKVQGAKATNPVAGKIIGSQYNRMTPTELTAARLKMDVHNKRK